MNRNGYKCRACRHGKPGSRKGRTYKAHGCATSNPKRSVR